MTAPDVLAARFARCVELFRDPAAREQQKTEFRILLGLLNDSALTFLDQNGKVLVNGVPVGGGGVGALIQRLALHNIGEIRIPQQPPPAEVFELLRALADPPRDDDVPTRLAATGATQISVKLAGVELTLDDATPAPRSGSLGTEGILRGSPMTDIASMPGGVAGLPITHDIAPPPPETALPTRGTAAPADALPAAAAPEGAAAQRAGGPAPRRGAGKASIPPPSAPPDLPSPLYSPLTPSTADQPVAKLLEQLESHPEAEDVGDTLAALGRHVEDAARANRIEDMLRIAAAIVRHEDAVPEGSARRNYGIALRRLYTKALLQDVATLLQIPAHREDATAVLRRGGADAVELLLNVLASSSVINERRAAFDALCQMKEGTQQVVQMLGHHEWFVVRNVAELAGELGIEQAVPGLARHLGHDDERVRKAAALALARIGTGNTAEPLRRALRDKSAGVRVQVALGVGGRRSSALAMPLVVALDKEEDEAVQRELLFALGRIGTSDAVQALIRASQPGRLFGRKPSALRLAAVEGLRIAGTPAAFGTLEGLGDDNDSHVQAAALGAIAELKRKHRKQ